MSPAAWSEGTVKRVRWLLLLPPCIPGALMLALGWAADPLWPAQDPTPQMQERYALARRRSDQLYGAGEIALLGGFLMCGIIAWKILRPPPPEEDEEDIAQGDQ